VGFHFPTLFTNISNAGSADQISGLQLPHLPYHRPMLLLRRHLPLFLSHRRHLWRAARPLQAQDVYYHLHLQRHLVIGLAVRWRGIGRHGWLEGSEPDWNQHYDCGSLLPGSLIGYLLRYLCRLCLSGAERRCYITWHIGSFWHFYKSISRISLRSVS